jgi:galactonate dehydratase
MAMREAVGPDVEVMVDCHSFFDVPMAERVARRLEPVNLAWYEEPVAPERIDETREIRRRIRQPMAAGEILYGVAGFAPLSRNRTVNVVMPDVTLRRTAELTRCRGGRTGGVRLRHNPSGPCRPRPTSRSARC